MDVAQQEQASSARPLGSQLWGRGFECIAAFGIYMEQLSH